MGFPLRWRRALGRARSMWRESIRSASPRQRRRGGRRAHAGRAPSPACGTAVRGIEIGCRRRFGGSLLSSWPAPEPAIHVAPRHGTTWIRGSSPRMTTSKDAQASPETRSRGGNTFPAQPCALRERGGEGCWEAAAARRLRGATVRADRALRLNWRPAGGMERSRGMKLFRRVCCAGGLAGIAAVAALWLHSGAYGFHMLVRHGGSYWLPLGTDSSLLSPAM